MQESPIFTGTHDLLLWLLQATRRFPREQRFVLAKRVQEQMFWLQDTLVAAALDKREQAYHLLQADIALTGLRKSLLLCQQLDLLSAGQFRHASEMTAELGRLLGAWRRQL